MENRFLELPPLKRFKLMKKKELQAEKLQGHLENLVAHSCLPAKKHKESRDFSPLPPNSAATTTTTTTCCLPAKKRVWAIQPFDFDLNVEFNPVSDDAPQKYIPDPCFNNQELGDQNEGEKIETGSLDVENENDVDDDDGIVCAICGSTDGDPSDPIVLCDGCDLMVHTTCYGHPFTNGVPENDWFCDQCLACQSTRKTDSPMKVEPFSCWLCPVSGGALKATIDGQWAHVVCSLFVPEVFFEDPDGRQRIDVSEVPTRRWKQRCYICKSKRGCAIDCSEPKCPLAFHVTCGLKEDLCIEYTEGRNKAAIVAGFCRSHTDLWMKQQQTGKFKIVARDKHEK